MLQSSIGYPEHLLDGAAAVLERTGPALIEVYAPHPEHCGIASDQVAHTARLAVDARALPLFCFDPVSNSLDIRDNNNSLDDWSQRSLGTRNSEGGLSELDTRISVADWAIGQRRFRHHFRIMSKGHLNTGMKPLTEFLTLDTDQREGFEPYIDLVDKKQRHFVATVSAAMISMTETALAHWRRLQYLAGSATNNRAETEASDQSESSLTETKPVVAPAPSADHHQALVEQLLAMSGYGSDAMFHDQSLRRFLETREPTDDQANTE